MVSTKEPAEADKPSTTQAPESRPVVLSEGAGIALGSVFSRLIKPTASERLEKTRGKRPRSEKPSVVFAQSEEVQEDLAKEKEEKRKVREAKKAKTQFENNALVIPDAATGAALEKELLVTATKGAVALFNAVSKAQKIAEEKPTRKKRSGPAVSRESFMDMMRAGVNKSVPSAERNAPESDSSDSDANAGATGAKWLKEDFLTLRSKKLKDWDEDSSDGGDSSDDGDSSDAGSEGEDGEGNQDSGNSKGSSD